MKAIAVAICVFLTAAPALAQMSGMTGGSHSQMTSNSDEQENAESSTAANGERLICRRVEPPSGSRVSARRICRTAEQWRAAQRDD